MYDYDDETGEAQSTRQDRIYGMYAESRLDSLSSFRQPFPSFRQPEDYYGHYVFPGSIRVPERPLSYATQLDWSKKMFQGVGIHAKEKTHRARKQSVRHTELRGVLERRSGAPDAGVRTG